MGDDDKRVPGGQSSSGSDDSKPPVQAEPLRSVGKGLGDAAGERLRTVRHDDLVRGEPTRAVREAPEAEPTVDLPLSDD